MENTTDRVNGDTLPEPALAALRDAIRCVASGAKMRTAEFSSMLSIEQFCENVKASKLIDARRVNAMLNAHLGSCLAPSTSTFADFLKAGGYLTQWQCYMLSLGRVRGFFLDQYTLLAPLGSGLVSNVYAARHQAAGSEVALAVLRPDRAAMVDDVRWQNRMKVATCFDNPRLIRVLDARATAGFRYHVREIVIGCTVHDLMHWEGVLPLCGIVALVAQLADAIPVLASHFGPTLQIPPGDILIDRNGYVRLNATQVTSLVAPAQWAVDRFDVIGLLEALLRTTTQGTCRVPNVLLPDSTKADADLRQGLDQWVRRCRAREHGAQSLASVELARLLDLHAGATTESKGTIKGAPR